MIGRGAQVRQGFCGTKTFNGAGPLGESHGDGRIVWHGFKRELLSIVDHHDFRQPCFIMTWVEWRESRHHNNSWNFNLKENAMSLIHRSRITSLMSAVAVGLFCVVTTAAESEQKDDKVTGLDGEMWTRLFDGKELGKWEIVDKYDFKTHGKVAAEGGCLVLRPGKPRPAFVGPPTSRRWTTSCAGSQTRRGTYFFCGLTFPVGDKALTLIMGGWGGWLVGLSCLDGLYAADNETGTTIQFENDRWYRVLIRVTKPKITVWIDDKETITLEPAGRKLSVSWEMEPCQPLGVATWYTAELTPQHPYRTRGRT